MHVTDLFPTFLELAGCKTKQYGGKPLDGKSFFSALWGDVDKVYGLRRTIFHGLDPVKKIRNLRDPRGDWKLGENFYLLQFELKLAC